MIVERYRRTRMRDRLAWGALAALAPIAVLASPSTAAADATSFYGGKTVTLYVGVKPSSGYAIYGRLLGDFVGNHIPGQPRVVVKYMPGAATLVLANYLYNVAPKDGTAFGLVHMRMGLLPLIKPKGIKYDSRKFNWIGSMSKQHSICFVWHTSSIRSIEDAKKREVLVGATNRGGSSVVFTAVINQLYGTKFKLVKGYTGTAGINLAIERGEVEGRCGYGWPGMKATKPEWVRDEKIRVLLQMGLRKSPELPGVPLITEGAKDEGTLSALEFLHGDNDMGRPFVAPPDVAKDRVAALRKAFNKAVADPELLARARKQNMEIDPITGEEIHAILARMYAKPQPVIQRVKGWMGANKKKNKKKN